jgi:DNA-binding HxlR family transcriptional regulator
MRVEYDLTLAGLKLVPLLDALGSWWDATEAGRSQNSTSLVQVTE